MLTGSDAPGARRGERPNPGALKWRGGEGAGGPLGPGGGAGSGEPSMPGTLRTPEGRERLMKIIWLISLAMLALGYALIFWIWVRGGL